jgi:hypothetical protein
MVQIIPASERTSFSSMLGQQLGSGLTAGVSEGLNVKKKMQMLAKENEAIKNNFGIDLTNVVDPEKRKIILQQQLQGQRENQSYLQKLNENKTKTKIESREKIAPFQAGLDTIQQMRDIAERGNLGRGSGFFSMFGGKTAEDYGKYEQLGKSIISLASTIPIRNQAEFETLAHNLYDPSIPNAQRKGILDALEEIIVRNMRAYQDEDSSMNEELPMENEESTQEKVIDSQTMEKIYELSKGDKEQARKIAKKMGYKI